MIRQIKGGEGLWWHGRNSLNYWKQWRYAEHSDSSLDTIFLYRCSSVTEAKWFNGSGRLLTKCRTPLHRDSGLLRPWKEVILVGKTSKISGSYKTITALVLAMLADKQTANLPYSGFEKEVLSRWPGSQFDSKHLSYFVWKANKEGLTCYRKTSNAKLSDPSNRKKKITK